MKDNSKQSKKVIRVHPAPPTALVQEIPTPDVVHTFDSPVSETGASAMQEQGRGPITSDVLGSYTGTPEAGDLPEQDPDDL